MMGAWPNLGYRDAAAAVRVLVDVFGFELGAMYEIPGSEAIAFAELRWPGGGGVMLHSAQARSQAVADICRDPEAASYPPFSIHVDTDDPDALYVRVVRHGAVIVRELADSPMGTRGFVVRDPEGLYWSFGTPLPRLVRERSGWRPDRPNE
jgi:uncharacterized glyoxalase superfamily protein PhnB